MENARWMRSASVIPCIEERLASSSVQTCWGFHAVDEECATLQACASAIKDTVESTACRSVLGEFKIRAVVMGRAQRIPHAAARKFANIAHHTMFRCQLALEGCQVN